MSINAVIVSAVAAKNNPNGRLNTPGETACFSDLFLATQNAPVPEPAKPSADLGSLSAKAHGDSAFAKYMLKSFVFCTDNAPLVDISQTDSWGLGVRYTMTGEPVTEESATWYRNETERIREERIALYEDEMSKNTPPAEILDKFIHFMDSQPKHYLELMNWRAMTGRTSS